MPIDPIVLGQLRPFLYHSSDALNFAAIERTRELRSAASLLLGTHREDLLNGRRMATEVVYLPDGPISVRDHIPLRPGSVALESGCTFDQFITLLNARVFFWLGTLAGPNRRGRAHRGSLDQVGQTFTLRVPTHSLLHANVDNPPYVTRCNSGSARHQRGFPIPRGPNTFRLFDQADFPARDAIELTFVGSVTLPPDAQFANALQGAWQQL